MTDNRNQVCPSKGRGPEHRPISGGSQSDDEWCEVCDELWRIQTDVIDGPIMFGAEHLVAGPDGIYRPRSK